MFFAPVARHHATSPTLRSFDRNFERFVNEALINSVDHSAKQGVQLTQDDMTWTLALDVPGLAREQLDIGIEGDVVRVSSKDDAPRKIKAAWRFPLEIDAANSTAKLENGVLTLSLGKKIPTSNISQLVIQ